MSWKITHGILVTMKTLSNRKILRVTGPLRGESTCNRWIILTKASDVELWCFLWSAPEQTVKQTIETPVMIHHRPHYDVTVVTNPACRISKTVCCYLWTIAREVEFCGDTGCGSPFLLWEGLGRQFIPDSAAGTNLFCTIGYQMFHYHLGI